MINTSQTSVLHVSNRSAMTVHDHNVGIR